MWTEKQIVDVFLLASSFSDVDKYPGCFDFLLARTNITKMTGPYKKLLQLHLLPDSSYLVDFLFANLFC